MKLKQVVMPLIELIQENNTINKLPLRYKGYADIKPCLLSVHNHQVILEKLKQENIFIMMNMWKKKITTMLIVMILILMQINNSYYMFIICLIIFGKILEGLLQSHAQHQQM